MVTKDVKRLIEKCNGSLARALEAAAGYAVARGHYEVALEHLLLKLVEDGTGDVPRALAHGGVDPGAFEAALRRSLDGFRTGNPGRPSFSPLLLDLIEAAWIAGSVHHGAAELRSGHLLEAVLGHPGTRLAPYGEALGGLSADALRDHFAEATAGSAEAGRVAAGRTGSGEAAGDGSVLDAFTQDLTAKARAGNMDPVFGRDHEIRQMVDILARRRKNNPILVGEPGVGKTAVVEGLALRIAEGDVPSSLEGVVLRALDLSALQAGAGVKGEFENRLKAVIEAVRESPVPIVLFIDEAHTLIGAGGAAGTSDAANMLKPALARGELRTVAATTWGEYKKYFEKDAALERRFQMVKVDEPSVDDATVMLRGVKAKYEAHHGLDIGDEAVRAAVRLSDRFITGRQLPDKAVDLLDTAAARVRISQSARPPRLDDLDRRLQNLDIEIAAHERDRDAGLVEAAEDAAEIYDRRAALAAERAEVEGRWTHEADLVRSLNEARRRRTALRTNAGGDGRTDPAPTDGATGDGAAPLPDDDGSADLDRLRDEVTRLQADDALVHAGVTESVVAEVVADWTGIPVGNLIKDEAAVLLDLEARLRANIRGQEEAIAEVADILRSAKAGMANPEAPIATFLFVGPSGVGKTEMAREVARHLFGGDRFLTTINMSEYQEAHTVSGLKGSPPGYVGYGEGGVLTEAVRQRPYSVVLLDEVEKAHRDVLNLFYQVFDKGFMRDGEGREIDFRNTVIMMTSNLGSDTTMAVASGEGERPSSDEVREALHTTLAHHFQPALLARMRVIPFFPLSPDAMAEIVRLKLDRVGQRLRNAHGMTFAYTDAVVDRLVERCTRSDLGARYVDGLIERDLMPEASRKLLAAMAEGRPLTALRLEPDADGAVTSHLD